MTCIIVNDASALIDLRKGRLLHVLGELPLTWVIPFPIREDEVLCFSEQDWAILETAGFQIYDLPGDQVSEAMALGQTVGKLSTNDCFCLVTARHHEQSVLLTGDRLLRRTAENEGIGVHGVLWVLDQLHQRQCCDVSLLRTALEVWRDDPTVRIPNQEIAHRLRSIPAAE